MNLKEYIKTRYKNWRSSINKRMYPNDVLTDRQKLVFSVFVDALNDSNCVRFLDVEEDERIDKKYIVSKDYFMSGEAELFITLITKGMDGDSKCNIVNHEYLYDEDFPVNTTRKMNKMFKAAVRRDRSMMELSMNKNSTNTLTKILIEFRERLKTQIIPFEEKDLIKDDQTVSIPEIPNKKKYVKQKHRIFDPSTNNMLFGIEEVKNKISSIIEDGSKETISK
jgi:hypothetical protein